MKALIYTIFLLLPLGMMAQQNSNDLTHWTQTVQNTGKAFPQEKVYLHLDNNCYFLGDTIWYKAYVVRSDRKVPTDLSRILYVELMTPDGYLVERQQIPLENDTTGFGNFALQDSLYGGYYEIRAYTRWMLNWGRYQTEMDKGSLYMYANAFYNKGMMKDFFTEYEKIYSRVVPVYDKPQKAGVYEKNMTMRPMRRYYKKSGEKNEPVLSFFPEGGNLIQGVPCTLAFDLADNQGKHLNLEIVFRESKTGKEILRTQPQYAGRGSILLPPLQKKTEYEAVVRSGEEEYTFSLPKIQERGCALSLESTPDSIRIRINTAGLPENYPLGMHILHDGIMKYSKEMTVRKEGAEYISLPTESLPTGVNQITLFDDKGEVFADRLFFVWPEGKDLNPDRQNLVLEGIKEEYKPFEPVTLSLKAPDIRTTAHLSLSVKDDAADESIYDDGTMLTEMLLASEIRGFVERPGYYFEKDDSTHRKALDNLLLVQGWRRWKWNDLAAKTDFSIRYLPEKYQTIAGAVHPFNKLDGKSNYDKDEILAKYARIKKENKEEAEEYYRKNYPTLGHEVWLSADYVQDTTLVETRQKTEFGYFYLPTPRFFGKAVLFMNASDKTEEEEKKEKEKQGAIKRFFNKLENKYNNFGDELAYPDYYVKLDHFFPLWPLPYSYYQTSSPNDPFEKASFDGNIKDGVLPTLTVRSKRGGLRKLDSSKPAFVVHAYDAFNRQIDLGMNTGRFGFNGLYRDDTTDSLRLKELARFARPNNTKADLTGYIIDRKYPPIIEFGEEVTIQRGFIPNITSLSYIGDMGVSKKDYFIQVRYDGKAINGKPDFVYIRKESNDEDNIDNGINSNKKRTTTQIKSTQIKASEKRNYATMLDPAYGGKEGIESYRTLAYLDKLYFYTDYCPRERSSWKYEQSNIPDVVIDLHKYPNGAKRQTYRDRWILLDGFAVCDTFYSPDYSKQPLPEVKDYRRTLYWNPNITLEPGETKTISFYNNSKTTILSYEAEGITKDGKLLVEKK